MSRTTKYMHTYNGKSARVVRASGGRAWLVVATPHIRVPLHDSMSVIRREWNECLETAAREDDSSAAEYARFGHVVVKVQP